MRASSLTPMLTVNDTVAAVDLYRRAFGATEVERTITPNGQIVAEMAIDGWRFFVVDENPEAFNLSPRSLGGTTARINLLVDDPDETMTRGLAEGGTDIFQVSDQPYGPRQGRLADPFGDNWLIGKPLPSV